MLIAAASALLLAGSSLRASDMDRQIESAAKKSYVFKHFLANDAIKTESKNGVVTLTGTVVEESHVGLAGDTLGSLPGVKRVDNRLVVRTVKSRVGTRMYWIPFKVKTALQMLHRRIRQRQHLKTEVSVNDGIVNLRGEASSIAQKELTTEYAKDVEGVKEVKNAMTITESASKPEETLGEKIDDASITAQVKMSLLAHHSTSALKTKVETTDGVVTLTGVAKNEAEKVLVSKLASDVKGVVSVINSMTIEVAIMSRRNTPLLPPQNLRIVSR